MLYKLYYHRKTRHAGGGVMEIRSLFGGAEATEGELARLGTRQGRLDTLYVFASRIEAEKDIEPVWEEAISGRELLAEVRAGRWG